MALVFRDVAFFRGVLYYFDVTEINYPYRQFLAGEIRSGRFARWLPELYCGLPLYSESQAGYWHPLKYVLYPWMEPWKAFNLDTVLSIWLAGTGAYGWLRRHVGPTGALTGAGIFALGGFTWAHLIHTSMVNALASVPFAVWALELGWAGGRWRAVALGAVAIACQVFAGHLQDTILTGTVLGLYALLRATGERSWKAKSRVLASAVVLVLLGGMLSAVQWIPSKELLDRSPRAGGLSWDDLTYGSWHPELLPTVILREAYGTRARDTDWMDGFYPYHEMDVYLGVVGLFLAAVGAASWRDRWVGTWIAIGGVGVLLMMGRFTFLLDFLYRIPIVGSSRIPVRFHLWVTLAVAALAAVGTDRLATAGRVRLRGPLVFVVALVLVSLPILAAEYRTRWTEPMRWIQKGHVEKFAWLDAELAIATTRTTALLLATIWIASIASRAPGGRRRLVFSAMLPALAIADVALAHARDIPTAPPSYWATPPPSVKALRSDPDRIRIYGEGTLASGEPGYASRPIDPLPARDALAWSLPSVWGLKSTGGETPLISRRLLRFHEWQAPTRIDLEGLSHVLSTTPARDRLGPSIKAGSAYIHENPRALPRARIVGRPVYADDEKAASRLLRSLDTEAANRVVVEDPERPLAPDAVASGTASITRDDPEFVEIATSSPGPSYLLLADTFDPGWSATRDRESVPIRPANVAFRAVFLPAGDHVVQFSYRPAGFLEGLAVSALGAALVILLVIRSGEPIGQVPDHGLSSWPRSWPWMMAVAMAAVILASIPRPAPNGKGLAVQERWRGSFHMFTWGAGIEGMKPPPPPMD